MSNALPFRLRVFAPRSVDPTETTVLTPRAGSVHADPFVVTSIQGVAGAKPYLDIPSARGALIDALNKKTTTSALTVRIVDSRVTPGGSNAQRWGSAFVGDADGGNQLLGRLVVIDRSADGGATWTIPYFTGRISAPALSGKLWIQLSLKGLEDDLDAPVYIGAPAPSVSYAALAQIAPLGLMAPVRADGATGYAGLPIVPPLRARIRNVEGSGTRRIFEILIDQGNGDPLRASMTQALVAAGQSAMQRLAVTASTDPTAVLARPPQVYIAPAGTQHTAADYTPYDLVSIDVHQVGFLNPPPNPFAPVKLGSAPSGATAPIGATLGYLLASTSAGGPAAPTSGTLIDLYISDPLAAPTDRTPLLIDDVDFVTHLADLCAGKFGRLDASGNPVHSIPFNANGVSGANRIPWRNKVVKASTLRDELEAICLAYHVAYYTAGNGAVTLVDLRRSAVIAPAWNLTDDDLVSDSGNLNWSPDRGSAVTTFFGTFYPEEALTAADLPQPGSALGSLSDVPDVSTVALADLDALSILVPELGSRSGDFKENALKVDAKGFRCRMSAQTFGLADAEVIGLPNFRIALRSVAIQQHFIAYADEIAGPFGLGPSYIDVICRVGSANVASVQPGTYGALALSALPDPATNQRGGPRLGLCVSRTENGGKVTLRILDAGENAVALPPTFGVPSNTSGSPTQSVSLPIVLNALSEPVRVAYAATDPSVVVAPAEDDPAWIAAPNLIRVSSTIVLSPLPAGQRIWLRARTVPGAGKGFKLPSAWAFPATTHIDLGVIAPPSALAVTGATPDALTLSWTNGDPTKGVEVFLAFGDTVVASDATRLSRPLPPGTIKLALPPLARQLPNNEMPLQYGAGDDLTALGASFSRASTASYLQSSTNGGYTVGVRAIDGTGGVSTLTTLTFVPPALVAALSAPIDARGFCGRQDARYGFPQADGVFGLAVAAVEFPGFISFWEAVETAPLSGVYGAAAAVARVPAVQGEWTLFEKVAPNDGLRRQLTARSERDGATASAWTDPVVVTPWTPLALGLYTTSVPTAAIALTAEDDTTMTLTLSGSGVGHLDYRYRESNGATMPDWGAWITAGADLPHNIIVSRFFIRAVHIELQVRQADGGLSIVAEYTVSPSIPSIHPGTGLPHRPVAFYEGGYAGHATDVDGFVLHASVGDSTGRAVAGMYHKPTDTIEDVADGAIHRRPTIAEADGGGRAHVAIDAGNVIVDGSIDFGRGYTNKHLGNIPDDPGGTRHAVAAVDGNQRPIIDFSQGAHVNKHLGNIPDDPGGTRHAVAAVDGNQRPIIDLSSAHVNKHLGNVPDDPVSGRHAVTSDELTGAGRAFSAIDASGNITAPHYQAIGNVNPYYGLNDGTYQAYLEISAGILRLLYNGHVVFTVDPATGKVTFGGAATAPDFVLS